MIKLFVFITLALQIFVSGECNAQRCNSSIRESDKPLSFLNGEGYIGGEQEFDNYIIKNRKIPQSNENGYVLIEVYIDSFGNGIKYDIDDFTTNGSEACVIEATRLIKNIKKWERPKVKRNRYGKSYVVPKFYSLWVYF